MTKNPREKFPGKLNRGSGGPPGWFWWSRVTPGNPGKLPGTRPPEPSEARTSNFIVDMLQLPPPTHFIFMAGFEEVLGRFGRIVGSFWRGLGRGFAGYFQVFFGGVFQGRFGEVLERNKNDEQSGKTQIAMQP